MSYPERILPNQKYRRINPKLLRHYCFFVTRHTPDKNYFVAGTKQIRDDYIGEPSIRVADLSLSLLGNFKIADNKIDIKDKKGSLMQPWKKKQVPIIPSINDFGEIKDRGAYFVCFNKLNNHKVPEENAIESSFNLTCQLIHRPVNWNFWHFETIWFDRKDNHYIGKEHKRWRATKHAVRTSIKELSTVEVPAYSNLPSVLYKRSKSNIPSKYLLLYSNLICFLYAYFLFPIISLFCLIRNQE